MVRHTFAIAVVLLWLAPALIGLLDIACWFWTGDACSPVLWHEPSRAAVAMGWLVLGAFVAVPLVTALEAEG